MKNKVPYIAAIIAALPALAFAFLYRLDLTYIIPAIFTPDWFPILVLIELIAGLVLFYFGINGLKTGRAYFGTSMWFRVAVILAAVCVAALLLLAAFYIWFSVTFTF